MNIWKIIYLNCGERFEGMIDHRRYTHNLSSCGIKAWKKFRPERNLNSWPLWYWCSALSTEIQAIWELVTLWVRNTPDYGDVKKWKYERSYIWTAEKDMKTWLIIAVINTMFIMQIYTQFASFWEYCWWGIFTQKEINFLLSIQYTCT